MRYGPFLVALLMSSCRSVAPEMTATPAAPPPGPHIRINLVGYHPDDTKIGIAFSHRPIEGMFSVLDSTGETVLSSQVTRSASEGWGTFDHYALLDFSDLNAPGVYRLRLSSSGAESGSFRIGAEAYRAYHEDLLGFMRQQRCGYNPFLDMVCHRRDGRSMYAPIPDSTYVDVSGGWHDAGDQLKYLITSSNATARMMLAFELEPTKFGDYVDELGHPHPNGIPDVLDEAKWGLDWIHKMHPEPTHLYHQVADDRDHRGWKWPDQDLSDYGWGPNSYRVAYFATGEPQGLREYKSEATGVSNLAGRSAAAMAMASRIWKEYLDDPVFASKCLKAATEIYKLGKEKEGYQQGNSYGAPYRYTERTWADDMEWGAVELFNATGDSTYLEDAVEYARLAANTSWTVRDSTEHYEMYPFVNVAHFRLYPHVDEGTQEQLAGFYREGIEYTLARGNRNPYRIGVPFIWCSNNLTTALITQILFYEKMTGDSTYHDFLLAQRDWLLGRNPWGTSMFMNIPPDGEYPQDVHTSVWALTKEEVPGGLVDGPVFGTIYRALRGIELYTPDEFADVQNEYVVYHDDIGDYSTNEPTMDGTAGAVYFMAHFAPHQSR